MLLKHNRNGKTNTQKEDFSWGEPFFKKKEWKQKLQPPQETKHKK
jgi:hypothetical protein